MALASLPPWLDVTPAQFVQAGNEGANAGIAAAHLRQAADQHAAQLAAEHARMQQQAALESSRLSQQQHLAEMEMQARKEVLQQDHLRKEQANLQLNAYRQSEIGLRQAELDRQQAVNDAVAREKAMTYAQQSGVADFISKGGTMAEGLVKFPMARGIAGALKKDEPKDFGPLEKTEIPGYGWALTRKGSAAVHTIRNLPDGKKIVTDSHDGSVKVVNPDGTYKVAVPASRGTGKILERLGLQGTNAPSMTVPPPPASPPGQSPYQEGDKIQHKDGSVHVIQNGVPVPVAENTTELADDESGIPTPEELNSENA